MKNTFMNSKTFLRTFVAFCAVFLMIACSKDDVTPADPCANNWVKLTEAERQDLIEKTTAFTQNPTSITCEAYRTSYLKYINALKKADACFLNPSDKAEYQQALNDAETDLREVDCSEFN